MNPVQPAFESNGFNCPHCTAFAQMYWSIVDVPSLQHSNLWVAKCVRCGELNIWRRTFVRDRNSAASVNHTMVFPTKKIAYFPEADMPDDVKADFEEAALIFDDSPRGAAALLRLSLQKLCKHLGEKGDNIDEDIRALAKNGTLSESIVKVADTVRITGNNAVHPGEMQDEDFDYVASKLFNLLNLIVKRAITEPAEIDALYNMTPEKPRAAAEAKDAKAKRV